MAILISTKINGTLTVTGNTTLSNLSATAISGDGAGITNIQWTNIKGKTSVSAGKGLTGGGSLDSSISLNVVSADDGIQVNDANIKLNIVNDLTTASTTRPVSAAQAKNLQDNKANKTTKINVAGGLTGGGTLASDVTITHPGSAANLSSNVPNVVTGITFSNGHISALTTSNLDNRYYTETEVDNLLSTLSSGMEWKPSVPTYDAILSTYPNPKDGWTVNVDDTDYTYRFTGTEWIAISANSIPLATASVDGKMSKAYASKLDGIATGANKYVHPNHTGDVTSTADKATVISANVVTNAKLSDVPTGTIKGRVSANTGDPEDLNATQVRALLNVANGAEVNQNAFSIVKVGTSQALAANKTDTFEFVAGSNISLTLDQTNKKLTIANTYSYTHPTYTTSAFTKSTNVGSVNLAYSTTQNNGHITGGTYKTLIAGTNITIDATVAGEIRLNNTYKYTHPTGDGNLHVPANGTTNNEKFLMAGPTAGEISWTTPPLSTSTKPGYLRALSGSSSQFLRGDGTWATPPQTTYAEYTGANAGLVPNGNSLTAQDKTSKFLRGDGTWQIAYTLPTASSSTLGGIMIGTGLSIASGKVSVPNVTTSANGLMLASDKTKLDGVQANANNYSHPNITRSNTTSSASPGNSGTFTVIDSVTTNAQGHVTGANTKTVTMPPAYTLPKATTTTLGGVIVGTNISVDANGKISIANYEPAFTKNSAFNKSFGTASGTVAEGNHTHSQFTSTDYMKRMTAAANTNFNTNKDYIATNRIIRLGTTETGLGTSPNYGTVMVLNGGSDTGAQIQFPYNTNEIYFRNYSFNTTTPDLSAKAWSRIWHSSNFDPNTKVSTTRKINVSGAITGGGDLTADRTISHSTAAGYVHLPAGGAAGQWLKWSSAGTGAWVAPSVLVRGSYLTGANYDTNAGTTWAVDATTDSTASKVVARDANGYMSAKSVRSELANQTGSISGAALAYRTSASDGHIRFTTDAAQVRTWLGISASILDTYTKAEANSRFAKQGRIFSNSSYSFTNGILVETNIPAESNTMINAIINGNGYGQPTINTHLSFYNYKDGNAIINYNAIAMGTSFPISVFNYGGFVCLWFKQTGNYQSFQIDIRTGNSSNYEWTQKLTNVAEPTTGVTRKITITPTTVWRSDTLAFGTGNTNMSRGDHGHTPDKVGLGNVPNTIHTTDATASTVAVRDGSADISVRLLRSNYANQSTISGAMAFRVNNGSDNYIRFCSDTAAIRTYLGVAASSHGNHVPTTETANNARFLRNDNTWQTVTPANIGAAATSHGNHVPATQTANNSVFLRNDNTWATVTPANIGAAPTSHPHNQLTGSNYVSTGSELPTFFGSGKFRYQMLGAGTQPSGSTKGGIPGVTWSDAIWVSSYTGGDVKGSNVLLFGKTADKIGFRRQNYDSTTWGTFYEIYHTGFKPTATDVGLGSVNNWSASSDATNNSTVIYATTAHVHNTISNKLGNVPNLVHTENATANTIPKRDANADFATRYFKSTIANTTTISGAIAYRTNNSSDNGIKFCSDIPAIKTFIQLNNVNNWGASSSISANSTTQYATTNMVAQVRAEKANLSGSMSQDFNANTLNANKVMVQGKELSTADFVSADNFYFQQPVGSIVAFAGTVIPLGWLPCDGRTITQAEYEELFELIGSKVPDLRGQFIRGLDNGRNIDTGRTIGSEQGDAIRNITASMTSYDGMNSAAGFGSASGAFYINADGIPSGKRSNTTNGAYFSQNLFFDAARVVPTANENRPKNIALNYIIKAKNVAAKTSVSEVVDEINNKIEKNRNDILENSSIKVLWSGVHNTNGTIVLSDKIDNYKMIGFRLTTDATNHVNVGYAVIFTNGIKTNNTATADNQSGDFWLEHLTSGTSSYAFAACYVRDDMKTMYIGGRQSTTTLMQVVGIK